MRTTQRNLGFTLVELLVVITIIATLAGVAAVGIPAYIRSANKSACEQTLRKLHTMLMLYNQKYKSFPSASGGEFVLAPWTHGIIDHNAEEAKIFFSAGSGRPPMEDVSELGPEDIDYTGPNLHGRRTGIGPGMANANEFAIICNRVPAGEGEELDESDFPHAGKGINVLFAGGAVKWFDKTDDFGGDLPSIGEQSPIEALRRLVPDDY